MLGDVHVLGAYWRDDADEATELGRLVAAAKDRGETEALTRLEERFAAFVAELPVGRGVAVVAVPPSPGRDDHPVPALAAAVARALGGEPAALVDRRHDTPRLRDTPPDRRQALVEAAGYEVVGDVVGAPVLLVDDVILTGTTLRHLADLLVVAGATRVDAVVVCRTRRR